MSNATAAVAGLASAVCFGLASAGQHAVASSGDAQGSLDPRLLLRLARRPAWLVAGALETVAVVAQVLALRWGPVSLVQPLLVLGLPIAVLRSTRRQGQRLRRRDVAGVALCSGGVLVVALALPGNHEVSLATGPGVLLPLLAVLAATVVLGQLAGARHRFLTGAAAGAAAGVAAAGLALCGHLLSDPTRLLLDWPPYLAVAAGVIALQLGQAAFQDVRLGAPLGAVTLAEPVTAIALSALVLHERLDAHPAAQVLTALAVLGALAGVALLVSGADEPAG